MQKNKDRHILSFKCLICNKDFKFQVQALNKRRYRAGEPICKKCYGKISKGGKYGVEYYPEPLRKYLKEEIWDYNIVKKYLPSLKSKRKVKFVCEVCNKEEIMMINMMKNRKICGIKPICRKCSLKYATNSDKWRDSNSKAQLIAQNRPEVIEKQRVAQFRLMREDSMYLEKRCSKTFISGVFRGFRFDSSWELYFIVHCIENKDVENIARIKDGIYYRDTNGKRRKYFPDFIVSYKNGKSKIIEIKGNRKYNYFHEKFNAARKKYGFNYMVYGEKDLESMGIFFRRESFLREFYIKYNSEILFYNNDKTEKFKKRIEEWLK